MSSDSSMSEKAGKAKDKAVYALGNLSTVMGRTTHKLMAKMGYNLCLLQV